MANKKISGITIALDADTKGITSGLKDITSSSKKVSDELKQVERLLKLNPGNTELLSQKQQLLAEQVQNTSEKLKVLKGAQADVNAAYERGDIGAEQYRAFQRELATTEGALSGYKGQLANMQTEQDRLGQNTGRLDSLFKATGSSIEDYQDLLGTRLVNSIKNGTASSDDLEVAINKIGKSALGSDVDLKQMKESLDRVDDGNSIEGVKNELGELSTKADVAGNSLDNMGKKLEAGNLMAAADQLSQVGDKIKDFASSAQDAFQEVDEGADIIVTKTGASAEAIESMNQVYKNLTNSLPVDSFADVGSAVGEMNTQFGFMDDKLEKSSEYLLKFANINEADVSNSAINARKAIEAYNLTNEDFNSVLDSVTKTAQNTGQAVDSLFDKAIKGAPQIKQLGLSFNEGVALMGKFEQSGVDSGKAISYLSKASVVYAKDNKTLLQGLEETSNKINNATSQTEALQIATEIFGTKGASVMEDAIARGALNLDGLAESAANTSGVVGQTFEDTLDPIDRQQVALNNVKNAMAEFGAAIAEALAPVLNTLIPIIQKIAEVFTALPTPAKQFIVILGGLIVLLTSLAPIITAIGVVGVSALAPLIGIIAGVAAAVTLVIAIFSNWGTITDWLSEKWEAFTQLISEIWSSIAGIASIIFGNMKNFFVTLWTSITETIKTVWQGIANFFGPIIQGIINIITVPLSLLATLLEGIWLLIKSGVIIAWEAIKIALSAAWNAIYTVAVGIFNPIKEFITGIWTGISTTVGGVVEDMSNTVNAVFEVMKVKFSANIDGMKEIIKGLAETFNNVKDTIVGTIKKIVDAIGKIKLPKFSLKTSSRKVLGKEITYPTGIDVKWFAEGGILTKPTIFGANGNQLMGGGEAGKEAIAPLDKLMGYIRQAVKEESGTERGDEIHLHLTAYGNPPKEMMDQMAEYFMYKFTDLKRQKNPFGGDPI